MAIKSLSGLLDEQIKVLTDLPAIINQRRENWRSVTKAMLLEKLKEIKERAPQLGLLLNSYKAAENQEFVQFCFGNQPSGISVSDGRNLKSYVKVGAVLSFTQLYSGKILAAYKMPYIAEIIEEGEWKAAKIFEPADISENDVEEVVSVFFKEVINWHDSYKAEKIGFKDN